MRKPINVKLNDAALTPLREACYERLATNNERVAQALEFGDPSGSRDVWAAHAYLARTATLLDRIGWTSQDHRNQVTLASHADVELAIDVLRDEAAAESANRAAALEDKATDAAQAAERATARELAIHNILAGLEAGLAAAAVARAASIAAEPHGA